MEKVTKNSFELAKVKKLKGGGLDVHYAVTEKVGDEIFENRYHVEITREIHPDLSKEFDLLKPMVANVFGMTEIEAAFALTELAKDIESDAGKLVAMQRNQIDVIGVSLSGSKDKLGCMITANYKTKNGMEAALNTPRIKLASSSFGFESDLQDICFKIENEVYEYLFNNKQAQLELFGEQQA